MNLYVKGKEESTGRVSLVQNSLQMVKISVLQEEVIRTEGDKICKRIPSLFNVELLYEVSKKVLNLMTCMTCVVNLFG